MNWRKRYQVEPGSRVRLSKFRTDDTRGLGGREQAGSMLVESTRELDDLQELMWADHKHALLVVLQGMDASGKDGTIKHVMSGVNPQGCSVTSFKRPNAAELEHDFLWRIHQAVPPAGKIGIFNRSHYEDVLIVRVHALAPKSVWSKRFGQINDFEEMLTANNIHVLKFFLHISKEEQARRLQARLDNPEKYWKSSPADFEERRYWDHYQRAYEDVLSRCSTSHAPWFVVPSDVKWVRNVVVANIIVEELKAMKLKYPAKTPDTGKKG